MTDFDERHKSKMEDLCMTKDEFNNLKDAFKKEEFVKLFAEYVDDVNDPKKKEIYEKEVKQLEKERGVDVTFIHPNPGYVIKTSVNGSQKGFINICHNDKIDKPTSSPERKEEKFGRNWSLPYIQCPPRTYFDKGSKLCTVYDVVFHPDTLNLAKVNPTFRKFVNNVALSAVEDNFKVTLDRRNIKFPKMQYKGMKEPTVVRRKISGKCTEENIPGLDIPNYPYAKLEENPSPTVVKHKEKNVEIYTTPKYIIKHHKDVDLQEYTYNLDSKVYAATPTELVVIIDLPLVKSASDVTLDVYEKSLSLISEQSAKYKLDIKLPWSVDEDSGNAKFDKTSKQLHITLPVIRKKYKMPEFIREDSGIESDPSQSVKSSSEEDISERIVELSDKSFTEDSVDKSIDEGYRTSVECTAKSSFLNPDNHYSFPSYFVNVLQGNLAIVFNVKNVDVNSVKHVLLEENFSIHICFSSVGSGFFPLHYAFYMKILNVSMDPSSLHYDSAKENLVVKIKLSASGCLQEYFAGPNPDCLKKESFTEPDVDEDDTPDSELVTGSVKEVLAIEKEDDSISVVLSDLKLNTQFTQDEKEGKSCESIELQTAREITRKEKVKDVKCSASQGKLKKSRTHSESSSQDPSKETGRRSILKCTRSLSESNVDDYSAWSSVDSSDSCIPEEMSNTCKKTVRFSDVVSEKVFRANSSILGQRKKNQRKARNKKRAQERRASESAEEASGSEMEIFDSSGCEESSVSETSEASSEEDVVSRKPEIVPSSKTHRRRGSKNKRKNANTAKHNTIFTADD